MSDFFAMGGHGFYVWGAYVVTAIVIVAEILALRARRRAALEAAQASTPDPQPPIVLGTAGRTR
jgi:heme exporter protein D